jgi:hypothetical protein
VGVRGVCQGLEQQIGGCGEPEPRRESGPRLPLGQLRISVRAARLLSRRGRGATQTRQRLNARVALVPPKPKPFEIAVSTSAFRATFGT